MDLEVEHIRLHGTPATYCGHPRQGGIWRFAHGELAVAHWHAGCCYGQPSDVAHDRGGYHSRACMLLQRSTDGGRTWPAELESAIYDEARPLEVRRRWLYRDGPRTRMGLSDPDTIIHFGRTWSGTADRPDDGDMICFALRSADRGRSWEAIPGIIAPPPGAEMVLKDNHPLVPLPGGRWVGAMSAGPPGSVWLYESDESGRDWRPCSAVVEDRGHGRPTYAGLLALPEGTLGCWTLRVAGPDSLIQVSWSRDDGATWSDPTPIVSAEGRDAWRRLPSRAPATADDAFNTPYRSPWPLMLQDGRILVLFARRQPPFGIGLTLSEDGGKSWSAEHVVRADGTGPDLGYPVAVELEPGLVFTAYYFCSDPTGLLGGPRHIGGSFIRLP